MMRLVRDKTVNGHSSAIFRRSLVKQGFIDVEQDDWMERDHREALHQTVINVIGVEWK